MSEKKKRKKNTLAQLEEAYNLKYGGIPSDEESLLLYVREHYPYSPKKMEEAEERIKALKWKKVEFVLFLVPTPSPRPRYDGNHFYVKGAAQNKKLIKKFIERHILYTRTEISMKAYLPTPTSSMTNVEINLAERKLVVPVGSSDVDNIMKTYMDMIQGHLLLNDNIVTTGHLDKYYSVKPRLEIRIRYQTGFDSRYNERRITKSKSYIDEFGNSEDTK